MVTKISNKAMNIIRLLATLASERKDCPSDYGFQNSTECDLERCHECWVWSMDKHLHTMSEADVNHISQRFTDIT